MQVEYRTWISLLRGDRRSRRIALKCLPRLAGRKSAAAGGRPLHRRAELLVRLVPDHADLLAVVDKRESGHREQEERCNARLRHVAVELRSRARAVVVPEE